MLIKSSAIERLLRENPDLKERRFGLPSIGMRTDKEKFNPTVQEIADAIDFYGFEVRDDDIAYNPDINLGGGNSIKCEPFPLSVKEMIASFNTTPMYKYPYTEGDDNIRKVLLDYVEQEGFINTEKYNYEDVDDKGLCVHNITFLPSTSISFNVIINIISKPGDVVLVTGPSYGLFTIRAERAGAEVEVLPLSKEDNWFINPRKLANKIDEINESLQKAYNRRRGYVPRVVGFLNTNPNNPTGKVMGPNEEELLRQISQVCMDRGVFVIDDLVYRDISYDENNIAKPISSIPGMFRNTISLFGLSKSHGLASLRAGFVVADEIIIREIVNRIFQEMDSSPDIVGRALIGAFNTTDEWKTVHKEYFSKVRKDYIFRYNLLKTLVTGFDSIKDYEGKDKVLSSIKKNIKDEKVIKRILKGLPYTKFPDNLEPESGFFAILDFTELKGKFFEGRPIKNERDLLRFFYKTSRIRFLIGQSISWPNQNELIARVTYALEENEIINAFKLMNDSLQLIEENCKYTIRFNELKDQVQMAFIKVDGWRAAYKGIIDDNYLESLNYQKQADRFIASFEEYKELVLVAEGDNNEILGYSCFDLTPTTKEYDSEIVSLYLKPSRVGLGIGKDLFIATAKHLNKLGKKNMILWCLAENHASIGFYEKLGGKAIGTKNAKIGDKIYKEFGFVYDLEKFN